MTGGGGGGCRSPSRRLVARLLLLLPFGFRLMLSTIFAYIDVNR